MKAGTIRFTEETREAVACEAAALGISAAEFIRDAALARAVASYERRGGRGNPALDDLLGRPAAVVQREAVLGRLPEPQWRPNADDSVPASAVRDELLDVLRSRLPNVPLNDPARRRLAAIERDRLTDERWKAAELANTGRTGDDNDWWEDVE